MNLRRSRTALGAALVATAAITAGIAAGIVGTPDRTDALPGPDESTVVAVGATCVAIATESSFFDTSCP